MLFKFLTQIAYIQGLTMLFKFNTNGQYSGVDFLC